MLTPRKKLVSAIALLAAPLVQVQAQQRALEEIVVVAQKREQSLQEAPLSVTALNSEQLETMGVADLTDLTSGAIPSLKVQPFFNGSTTMVVAMRGIGSSNAEQITKDLGVGIYVDGVYLGRATGLSVGLTDLEQIEVLKGPQGSLYGRNSLGGAVNMISSKPSGELGFKQQLSLGNYNAVKSSSHLDLPEMANVSTKLSYTRSGRDGLVENNYPGAEDFEQQENEGARLALRWSPNDSVLVDYAYEQAEMESTSLYFTFTDIFEVAPGFQLFDNALLEQGRQDKARFAVPLDPSTVDTLGHNLVVSWELNDQLTLKSISAYREMDEQLSSQYGGIFSTGLNNRNETNQDQFSQEFQLLGKTERLEYIAGLYWYEEEAGFHQEQYGTMSFSPLVPGPAEPTPFFALPVFSAPALFVMNPGTTVATEVESWAAFGQVSWTPPVLNDQLELTLGLRYTDDEKIATRSQYRGVSTADISDFGDTRVDPTISINYLLNDDVSIYARYATGYRAGGSNITSLDFATYEAEEVVSSEVGLKGEFWENRIRVMAAYWNTTYSDKQVDFPNPADVTETATINASNGDVDLSGFELDVSAIVGGGLRVDLTYEYMDGSIEDQLNPFTGLQEAFAIQSLPRHSGSLTLDYEFEPLSVGTLSANLNYVSSAGYVQNPKNLIHNSSKDLVNVRLTLADIALGGHKGKLKAALWGKNLTDKEYIITGIQSAISGGAAWGEPRTYGLDLTYEY